ncbi:MAG: response regulator [Blastocatellia bacterium]|nr:response regulator [Blastocatellia bacterium]MBN8722247.1 response regulator [Acidobacteriota bacterium]
MSNSLRVIIVDDERPARMFLTSLLKEFDDVEIVAEASNGIEAVELIELHEPDLVLLDLQMPGLDGFGVVKSLKKRQMPLIAFVTAYDEYAVRAFELNAIDYLLKPVEKARLKETLLRAYEFSISTNIQKQEEENLDQSLKDYELSSQLTPLERIPIKNRDEIVIVPVNQIASVVADGELLCITTISNESYVINYRLKNLELRLDPTKFVRLGRGALVNIDTIAKINQIPDGTYMVTLTNNQQVKVSRIQSRPLRERLLRL